MRRRYRLYFDESGDHTYRELDDPAKRYLGVTGLVVECEYYRTVFHPAVEALKQKHFPHSPDEPVILHRKELIGRRGPFSLLRDPKAAAAFDNEFLALVGGLQYLLITVVIDKQNHQSQYGQLAYHPYDYCIMALLERYCGFLHQCGAVGDLMGEARGRREDQQLREGYSRVLSAGTRFRAPTFFNGVLTGGDVKLVRKEANIAGLQVADLLAFSSKQDCLVEKGRIADPGDTFARRIAAQVAKKYNREYHGNRVEGYGKVLLGFK